MGSARDLNCLYCGVNEKQVKSAREKARVKNDNSIQILCTTVSGQHKYTGNKEEIEQKLKEENAKKSILCLNCGQNQYHIHRLVAYRNSLKRQKQTEEAEKIEIGCPAGHAHRWKVPDTRSASVKENERQKLGKDMNRMAVIKSTGDQCRVFKKYNNTYAIELDSGHRTVIEFKGVKLIDGWLLGFRGTDGT
jgi:Zn finger protein HypA/HybF involved in hydrogenase expression